MPSRFVTSTTAPTHPGRFRGASPLGIGAPRGGAFLPDIYPGGRQTVEAAFGADVTADPSTWVWSDITTYCLWDPGSNTSIGYPNESAGLVPAEFTISIRNDQPNGGWFTQGNAMSPLWPDVAENTPIRRTLDAGYGSSLRFQGYSTSWAPGWDANEQFAIVELTANGVHRRVKQGKAVIKSPIRRFFETSDFPPVAYWTLEDSSGATQAASALPGGAPMMASGGSSSGAGARFGVPQGRTQAPYTGYDIVPIGARSFVSLAEGGILTGQIPPGVSTRFTVQLIGFAWPFASGADVILASWLTPGGPYARYDLRQNNSDSGVDLVGVSTAGVSTTLISSVIGPIDEFNYAVSFVQNGANIDMTLYYFRPRTANVFGNFGTTSVAGTLALPTSIALNATGATADRSEISGSENQLTDIRLGHVGVWFTSAPALFTTTTSPLTGTLYGPWNAYSGESPTTRMARLCAEEGIPITITGSSDLAMGPQREAAFFDLLDDCVQIDQGLLVDGLGPGYTYVARTELYGQAAQLVLDAAGGGDIIGPSRPAADDQGRVNSYEARNPSGSSAVFNAPSGPLSAAKVGTYDDSGDHRTYNDGDLYNIAAWRVAQGTVQGLRYPRLEFELAKPHTAVQAARNWLMMTPFMRLRALGLGIGQPDPNVDLVLRGWREKTNSKQWRVIANTSPYGVFDVTSLDGDGAAVAADTLGWLDTDGSTVLRAAAVLHTEGFESGLNGYYVVGGSAVASTAIARTGSGSLLLTVSGSPAQAYARPSNIAVTPGQLLTAASWCYTTGTLTSVGEAIDWFDASSGYLSTSAGTSAALAVGAWELRYVVATVPVGAAFAQYGPTAGGSPANGTLLYVDDCGLMETVSAVTPAGPLWYPTLTEAEGTYLNLDGLRVALWRVIGTASPQQLVVDAAAALRALNAQGAIAVWDPVIVGL